MEQKEIKDKIIKILNQHTVDEAGHTEPFIGNYEAAASDIQEMVQEEITILREKLKKADNRIMNLEACLDRKQELSKEYRFQSKFTINEMNEEIESLKAENTRLKELVKEAWEEGENHQCARYDSYIKGGEITHISLEEWLKSKGI